jgi:poly(3-hydroxybutyrate) depolymerase
MCGNDATSSSVASEGGSQADAATSEADAAPPISDGSVPHYDIDLTSTSVSGISSGGFMAVQFHLAFASIMKGAAVFAGGPYMCSGGSIATATTSCTTGNPPIDVASLVALTKQNATSGFIDDPSALASQRMFVFGGADDGVVSPTVVDAVNAYYGSFAPSTAIQYVSRRPGTSHTWPTLDYGTDCDSVASPFLGNCNYDGAGLALAQIYGTLAARNATPAGAIVPILQGDFVSNPAQHSLADTAYAYVPTSCSSGETCKIHVAFHGCLQSESQVADAFYRHSGLNEWADTNHIIVLYPQTIASSGNPEGCWDFWGYDSPDFAKKSGPQIAMVRAMIDAIAKK